ncbi:MAG: alanine--tRNA ligase, partial [Rhodospirillales bacterium]|nr:alanine--tRNA ligase [Rhodospirillales bacterium]
DGAGNYSTELCGGTHVHRTGDIAVCKVISESAVAAGVRRIEVVTAQGAEDYFRAQDQIVQSVAATLKSAPADVTDRVAQLVEDRKRLEKELSDVRRQMAAGGGASGGDDTRDVAGTTFVGRVVEGVPAKELKGLADDLKTKLGSGVVALVAVDGDKASLVVGVTDDLTDKFSAVDLVREGAAVVGGKGGGGRPDMAQAGGPDGSKATEALAAIEAALSE